MASIQPWTLGLAAALLLALAPPAGASAEAEVVLTHSCTAVTAGLYACAGYAACGCLVVWHDDDSDADAHDDGATILHETCPEHLAA